MKENKKRFTAIFSACFLLLYMLPKAAVACCSPPCPSPCQVCTGIVCVNDNDGVDCGSVGDGHCKECSSGECVYKSGNDCEETSDCDNCDICVDCKCEDSCHPEDCEECIDDICQSTCADCLTCVAGSCIDIECYVLLGGCQRCNETTGECEYSCSDEGCGEICVDNECVPDCDAVGSTCDWTSPPIQSNCPYTNPIDDFSCAPGVTGLTCDWIVVSSYSHSATGPCKISGGYCATLEPVVCKDKFIPTMGMVCGCIGTPALIDYAYVTPRYDCPE